uniref:Uncharacterized protein n=1 Tax=Cacopsylla melanoneura TaxID=428564 RepID=A0A8D9EA97_9HEMI
MAIIVENAKTMFTVETMFIVETINSNYNDYHIFVGLLHYIYYVFRFECPIRFERRCDVSFFSNAKKQLWYFYQELCTVVLQKLNILIGKMCLFIISLKLGVNKNNINKVFFF